MCIRHSIYNSLYPWWPHSPHRENITSSLRTQYRNNSFLTPNSMIIKKKKSKWIDSNKKKCCVLQEMHFVSRPEVFLTGPLPCPWAGGLGVKCCSSNNNNNYDALNCPLDSLFLLSIKKKRTEMSLFKARDFWEARGGEDEEYSGPCTVCYQLLDGLGKCLGLYLFGSNAQYYYYDYY